MDANKRRRTLAAMAAGALVVLIGVLVLTSGRGSDSEGTTEALPGTTLPGTTSSSDSVQNVEPVEPGSVYDPVRAGERTPQTFRQLLGRDQIAPVYDPTFTPADDADWPSDVLVIGVVGEETAKAYPVSHLNRREMVIDHIDGDPILVTW